MNRKRGYELYEKLSSLTVSTALPAPSAAATTFTVAAGATTTTDCTALALTPFPRFTGAVPGRAAHPVDNPAAACSIGFCRGVRPDRDDAGDPPDRP